MLHPVGCSETPSLSSIHLFALQLPTLPRPITSFGENEKHVLYPFLRHECMIIGYDPWRVPPKDYVPLSCCKKDFYYYKNKNKRGLGAARRCYAQGRYKTLPSIDRSRRQWQSHGASDHHAIPVPKNMRRQQQFRKKKNVFCGLKNKLYSLLTEWATIVTPCHHLP